MLIGLIIEVDDVQQLEYSSNCYPACQGKESKTMASQKVTASLQDDKGTWTVRGRVFDPSTGRMKQRTKSTGLKVKDKTKRKAEKMMEEIIEQWQDEAEGVKRAVSPPFSVYVQKFIERKQAKRIKANTIKSYQDYISCHIMPKLGAIPIAELTLDDLEEFYSEFLKTHKVSSARKVHVVVTGAVKEAVRDGIFQSNFADCVEFPTSHKFTGAAVYTESEVNTLLAKAKEAGEPIRAAVTLAVCYGLRRSEVLGLRWKDIDFERGTLTVSNTIVQNGELRIEAEQTKTRMSNRSIGLLPMTIPYLEELKEQQTAAKLKTDKVVAWMDGQEVRGDFISRKTKQLMKKCGLPVIRFHDLRHTVSPKQLQEFLGHEDISTTFGIYTHVLDEQKKATSAAMSDVLKNVSVM